MTAVDETTGKPNLARVEWWFIWLVMAAAFALTAGLWLLAAIVDLSFGPTG